MNPPIAKKKDHILTAHSDVRNDPYYWLRERNNPEVLEYLKQENEYLDWVLRTDDSLEQELFEEMKKRYKEREESLPYFFNGYWYFVRFTEKGDYPIFYRKKGTLSAEEEHILDVNVLAEGLEYFDIGSLVISPSNNLFAISYDTTGDLLFDVKFKNIETDQYFGGTLTNTSGKVVFSTESKEVFYIKKNKQFRSNKVYLHSLYTEDVKDELVFHEKDKAFDLSLYKSKSQEYIFIASSSSTCDEHYFVPADLPRSPLKLIEKRQKGLEYTVEHYKDRFYMITNADGAQNFKITQTAITSPGKENWVDVVSGREDVLIEGFELFENFLVLEEREKGLLQIKVINLSTGGSYYIPFNDPTYTAYIGINLQFDTHKLVYHYTSLTTPSSSYELDMKTRESKLLRQKEIADNKFKVSNYISERVFAPTRDEKEVPISLVYRKDTMLDGNAPLLLYGYGSYGDTIDPMFSSTRLSLLDRGFVFAIAHVRGGEYLGRTWYEEGKLFNKKNTFYDFIDAAEYLVKREYTSSSHLYGMGGSAGGLLVGAVMNLAPELFNGIVAQMPFVDVVTTMLDPSIPLTTGEYEEWGDPRRKEDYDYMKSYSPYDNITNAKYPHLLVTTALNDAQVQYWEPVKWVARLREHQSSDRLLLLHCDLNSGHGGRSGRFESLREEALEQAFLLKIEKNDRSRTLE